MTNRILFENNQFRNIFKYKSSVENSSDEVLQTEKKERSSLGFS